MKRQLKRLFQNKAAGLESISPRVLKTCVGQLGGILQHLLNLTLSQEKIPVEDILLCSGTKSALN